ncbi:hypothetical protein CH263_08405 [Rhodococcus sp. 06-1059B-a]|nr:hypothetical protein CH263_08405 [Rhodococcus sp. 06-1059B-a]
MASHHNDPSPDAFRWFSHPLTSVITLVILTLLIALIFDREFGILAFFALLAFLQACAEKPDS